MSKLSNSSPLPSLHDTTASSSVDSPSAGGFFPRSKPGMKHSYRYEPRQGAFSIPNRSTYQRSEPGVPTYQQSDPSAYQSAVYSPKSRTRELAQRVEQRRRRRQQQIAEDRSIHSQSHGQSYSMDARSYASRSTFQQQAASYRTLDDRSASAFTASKSPVHSNNSVEQRHLTMADPYPRTSAMSDFVTTQRYEPLSPHSLRQHHMVESRLKEQMTSNSRPWRPRSVSPSRRSVASSTKESSQFQSRFYEAARNASSPARDHKPSQDSLSKLMSRLSTIDRSNPERALQEIDQLLRQESLKGAASADEPDPSLQEEESAASSDDETSVSSITNPTYQPKPQHELFPKAKSKDKLKSYAVNNKSRGKRSTSPPPPMIGVKEKRRSVQQSSLDVSQDTGILVEEPFETTASPRSGRLQCQPKTVATENEPEPEPILMTTTSDDLGSIVTPKQSPRSRSSTPTKRRSHPWDDALPVAAGSVDVRDTSANSKAIGKETLYRPKYEYDAEKKYPESPGRNLRRERLAKQHQHDEQRRSPLNVSTESISLGVVNSIVEPTDPLYSANDIAWVALPESTYFTVNNQKKTTSRKLTAKPVTQRPTVEAHPLRPSRKPRSTNPFDDSIDSSQSGGAFAVRANQTSTNPFEDSSRSSEEKLSCVRPSRAVSQVSSNPFDEDSASGTVPSSSRRRDVSRNPFDSTRPRLQTFRPLEGSTLKSTVARTPTSSHRSGGGLYEGELAPAVATSPVPAETAEITDKTRPVAPHRGFRGLFRRKSAKGSEIGQPTSSSAVVTTRPLGSSATARGRSYSQSPSRTRSRSQEERHIRNPNLAKKFGKLSVYDGNDRGGKAAF